MEDITVLRQSAEECQRLRADRNKMREIILRFILDCAAEDLDLALQLRKEFGE